MPKHESLDDLVAKKAAEFADQIRAAAAMAANEEEIRIESERQLAFIEKAADVKLEGRHEFTVASGRIDSVYSRVIIEYKNPKSPGDRIGPKPDSPGSKKVVEQIKKRFYDMRTQHRQPLNSLFGVGLDGNYFIFVRFRDEKWQVQEPVEVNRHSAERFLWALFNLGNKGKPFSPEYLAGDFGSEGGNTVAIDGIHALYGAVVATDNPRAQTFFSQWKILFGEVCGYDVDHPSDKIKQLADFYQVGVKNLKPAEMLFAVHTYYALFMKLLASEIVAFFHKLPTPLQKMMQAGTSAKLKREMEDLEAGSIFRHLNVTNFLEGDLFAWYTSVWTAPIEKLVRDMVARLDNYNPGTLSEDPAGSRDLLKKLYQQLFPKSVRHDLGEYYTPDWLAEHVLNELGYTGDPDKRLLDPACGSGTFLVMSINRIRQWYDENREKRRFDEGELCRKILSNVIGFDLNPLAVMAARTNYLIAIRDLIGRVEKVEIPVYLCDSILTPSEYGGLFTGKLGKAKELKTAAARFLIPTEIATSRDDVAKYAEQLEHCVRSGYSTKEFIERCQEEGLRIAAQDLHADLYKELVKLDKANKNGVWARIIKNAFAPLFVGRFDYVAGNPPWVNWNNLPQDYRADSKPLWQKYGLWPRYILGASADFSKLFFYAVVDNYLQPRGRIGFVITQSIFKTFGGNLFRRFVLPQNEPIGCWRVDDMVAMQPFEGATNRTSVVFAQRGLSTKYPVSYVVWTPSGGRDSCARASFEDIAGLTTLQAQIATPVLDEDVTTPWLTNYPKTVRLLKKATGKNAYESYIGVHTYGANGIFFVNKVEQRGEMWLVQNDTKGIKTDVTTETFPIESGLLARLLRGRDVQEEGIERDQFLIFPYSAEGKIVDEGDVRAKYPKGYAFLRKHMGFLGNRSEYVRRGRKGPWYQLFCIYPATFAPYKVVWREQSSTLTPAVLIRDGERPIIPDHKLMFIPCWSEAEADYVFGLLSCTISRVLVKSVSIETQNSTRVMDMLALPRFRQADRTHLQIAANGKRIRATGRRDECGALDDAAVSLWGLTVEEQNLLAQLRE
jgi:methylase of polypeptide subunit release factors